MKHYGGGVGQRKGKWAKTLSETLAVAKATKANTEDIKNDTADIKALLIENTRKMDELHALHIQGRTVENATPQQLQIQAATAATSLKQIGVAAKATIKAQAMEAKAQAAVAKAKAKAKAKAAAVEAKAAAVEAKTADRAAAAKEKRAAAQAAKAAKAEADAVMAAIKGR